MSRRAQLAASMIALGLLAGCAAPGSTASSDSPVLPLSASTGPAASAEPAASTGASSDPGLGDTRPPCPFAQTQSILGPHLTKSVWATPTVHRPYGDVGVNYGPQLPGATVLWARLDVVVTDRTPIPGNPAVDPGAFASAEDARPDSFRKLMAGTDPHVARVTLKPFAPGPFVLPAAVLNTLPSDAASYTVYLVESVDESVCFGATPDPSLADFSRGSGYSEIAELVP